MKYLFAVNPVSGKGKTKKRMNRLEKLLIRQEIDYTLYETKPYHYAQELRKIIIEQNVSHVFAVGGDGTAHEVVNAVVGLDVYFGIIPFGSGNDFARSLKLPKKIDKVCQMILRNEAQMIDIGQFMEERYFLNYLSFGIDVAIVQSAEKFKRFGKFAYLIAIFQVIFKYKPKRMKINGYDDFLTLAAIHNGNYYGGGMKVSPEALVDDGLLNLLVVRKIKKWKFVLLLPSFIKGKHLKYDKLLLHHVEESFKITPDEKTIAGVDGEFYYFTEPFNVKVVKNAVKIIR